MNFYVVDKEYVRYLRSFDERVSDIDYENRLKPYIGIILEINELKYYVPISSYKPRYEKLKNDIDFFKIIDPRTNQIYSALNLNNMIPIEDNYVRLLKYDNLREYRIFENEKDFEKFVLLLKKELHIINANEALIRKNAITLYKFKIEKPETSMAKRCCDFRLLEQKCKEYKPN